MRARRFGVWTSFGVLLVLVGIGLYLGGRGGVSTPDEQSLNEASPSAVRTPTIPPPPPGPVSLVRGMVTGMERESKWRTVVTVRIVEVYCGMWELKGKRFYDNAAEEDPDARPNRYPLIPVPVKGEEGIWAVRITDGDFSIISEFAGHIWPMLPSLRGASFRGGYPQAKRLAEAIRSVQMMTNSVQRTMILGEYAFSELPAVSTWATRELLLGNEESRAIVLDQDGPKAALPVAGKLVVDEVLGKQRGLQWMSSDDRYMLLLGLAGVAMSELETLRFRTRVFGEYQNEAGVLSASRREHVARVVLMNQSFPASEKASYCYALGDAVRETNDVVVMDVLLTAAAKGGELSRNALHALGQARAPTAEQILRLQRIRDSTRDAVEAESVDAVLENWREKAGTKGQQGHP